MADLFNSLDDSPQTMDVLFVLNPLISVLIGGVLLFVWRRDKEQVFARDIAVWYFCLVPVPFLFLAFASPDPWLHRTGGLALAFFIAMGHTAFLQGVRSFVVRIPVHLRAVLQVFCTLFLVYLAIALSERPSFYFGLLATLVISGAGIFACFRLWPRGGPERFLGLLLIGNSMPNVILAIGGEGAYPASLASSIFFRSATAFAFVLAALARSAKSLEQANTDLELRVDQRTLELARANVCLAQSNAEMETTLTTLRQTQIELVQREKLAALGRMVAGIAHELNTPIGTAITVITALSDRFDVIRARLAAGQMRKSELDHFVDDGVEAIRLLQASLYRSNSLIEIFRDLARDNSDEPLLEIPLSLVLHAVADNMRTELAETPFTLHSDIAEGVVVKSYAGHISQVLLLLMENAKVHAFADRPLGTIYLVLRDLGDSVEMEVSDDGRGINPEYLGQVFDPFFTTRMGRSLGLGLNTVHTIVTGKLGGRIAVTEVQPHGVRFCIQLPKVLDSG